MRQEDGTRGALTIGELAARTGASVRSLRYYEQHGLLRPDRTEGGWRFYSANDVQIVAQIQELLRAGFCSTVIRGLLLPLECPAENGGLLREAFAAARVRLESERDAIDAELKVLAALEDRVRVATDTHVRSEDREHDRCTRPRTETTPFDHRDRRLR
ncbi:MerR family transcriptional regulator [Microbacterium sp. TNHR37B]|uniref:MerR family transcriptional regulator n=1 Tax=Microbacterium sp. TNHR37B TaxID=1775956 RepID=UPI000B0E62AC|nr:MerR family transcriptional regulator [Microbacterium sp. TNHR37B]